MFLKGVLFFLLFFTDFKLTVPQETDAVLKIGVILDNSISEESLRQAVDKLTEHHRLWLPQSRIITIWRSLNSSGSLYVTKTVCGLLNSRIQALVTALRCPQLKSVAVIAEHFNIPHVSVSLEPCRTPRPGQFTIHLATQYQTIQELLSGIAVLVGRRRITLVFDKSVENHDRQDLVLELSKKGIESVLTTLSSVPTMSMRHQNVAVITSANLPELISLGATLQVLDAYDGWIIFPTDVTVNSLSRILTSYSSSKILLAKPRHIADMVLFSSISCIQLEQSLPLVELKVLKALALYWLAVANMAIMNATKITSGEFSVKQYYSVNNSTQLLEQIQRVCGSGNDEPGIPCILTEYDLYSTQTSSNALVHVGEWTVRNKLTTLESRLFLNDFTYLGNSTIRIATSSNSAPFSRWNKERNTYEGLLIDVVEDLSKMLKFSYTLTEAPDGFFGTRLSNGSWTGLIGMVARREVEFAAAHFTVTPERSEVVDFTTPFMQDSLGILAPKPKEVSDMFQFFKPFSTDVWLSYVAFVFAAIITLTLISVGTYSLTGKKNTVRNCVTENVILVISCAFEQGPTFHPRSISARCFLTFWFMFSLLIMTMYTANLAAVLTVSTPLEPINTLQDLVDQRDMKVLVQYGTSTWSLFSESDRPIYQEVYKKVEKYQHSLDPVKNGDYSFVADRSYLDFLAMAHCEDTRLTNERFQSYSLAFAVPKNVVYKNAIDLGIQTMVESGVLVKLIQKWWTPSANCSGQSTETNAVVLSLDRVGGIFIVYIGMCIAAGFCLLSEHIFSKCYPRNICK